MVSRVNSISKKVIAVVCGIVVILGAVLGISLSQASASANMKWGWLEPENFDNIPLSDIRIDPQSLSDQFGPTGAANSWRDVSHYVEYCDNRFEVKNAPINNHGETLPAGFLKTAYIPNTADTTNTFSPASGKDCLIQLRLSNYAYDKNGERLDLIIKMTNYELKCVKSFTKPDNTFMSVFAIGVGNEFNGESYCSYQADDGVYHAQKVGSKSTWAFHFVKHGTNTKLTGQNVILGFDDLDICSYEQWSGGETKYNEGIELISPNPADMYLRAKENFSIAPEITITPDVTNQIFRPHGDYYNDNSYNYTYGFASLFPNGEGKFAFTGGSCGAKLFEEIHQEYPSALVLDLTDIQTETPQGDAGLSGGVYQLKNAGTSDIEVEGKTYAPGSIIRTLTTNADGIASIGKILPFGGTYTITQVTPPTGYTLTGEVTPYTFTISGKGSQTIKYSTKNTIIRALVEIEKYDSDFETLTQGLQGAEFSIYNVSALETQVGSTVYGTYGNTKRTATGLFANKYKIGEYNIPDTATPVAKLVTDANGYAKLSGANSLPYGTYVIKETKAPVGYEINTDLAAGITFTVRNTNDISFTKDGLNL